MTIQLVGGPYHGESRPMRDGYDGIIRFAPVEPLTIDWEEQRIVHRKGTYSEYRYAGVHTVVAGESRKVYVYTGR